MLGYLGTGLAVGLAGCSGGGDETTDDGDGDAPEDDSNGTTNGPPSDDQSETPPSDSTEQSGGEITASGESAVEGLEIVEMERQGGNSNKVLMITTVRNTGREDTDLSNYNFEMSLYESGGERIEGASGYAKGEAIPAGESGTINVSHSVEGDVSAVARAEISINCKGALTDGVYCES